VGIKKITEYRSTSQTRSCGLSYIYVGRERSWCFAVNNLLVYSKHKAHALNIYG